MITLILAHDETGGIGKNNDLPWPRISQDMAYFRRVTKGHAVIMGRKTFESLGSKPLPGRLNIVLSRQYNSEAELPQLTDETKQTYLSQTNSLERAFAVAEEYRNSLDVFVIGGAGIYTQALPYAGAILITKVTGTYDADAFFKPDVRDWILGIFQEVWVDEKQVCVFQSYRRTDLPLKFTH